MPTILRRGRGEKATAEQRLLGSREWRHTVPRWAPEAPLSSRIITVGRTPSQPVMTLLRFDFRSVLGSEQNLFEGWTATSPATEKEWNIEEPPSMRP